MKIHSFDFLINEIAQPIIDTKNRTKINYFISRPEIAVFINSVFCKNRGYNRRNL